MVERREEDWNNNKITERVTKNHQIIGIKRGQDQPNLSRKGRNKKPGKSQLANARLHKQKARDSTIPDVDRPQALENQLVLVNDQATQEGSGAGRAYVGRGYGGVQ